jgi:mRNA interferase HicA
MKRTELIKKITDLGAILERHGAKHDWYVKKETNIGQAVPRHNEIKDTTARRIIKAFS